MLRKGLAFASLAAVLVTVGPGVLGPGVAHADSATGAAPYAGPEDPTLRPVAAERRSGLVVGVAPGVAFAGASGYPNNVGLLGNQDYYSQSPLLVGSSVSYFLMGALTDWLNFGPVVTIASAETDAWKSSAFGVGFRGEVFPFYRLFPTLADTAAYAQVGVGSTQLEAKGPYPNSDGTQSFAGIGLHHEFRLTRLFGGHLSGGPYVEYDAVFSQPSERHWGSIGFRLAFYGGTVAADAR